MDTRRELVARQDPRRQAVLCLGGGAALLGFAALVFALKLRDPGVAHDPFATAPITALATAAVFALTFGATLARRPSRIVVDGSGIETRSLVATRRIAWAEVAEVHREMAKAAFGLEKRDSLTLLDARGKRLVTLADVVDGFAELAALVEARSTAARGAATHDLDRERARKLAASRRKARVLTALAGLMAVLGGAAVVLGASELRDRSRLARDGVEGEARIVRRYMWRVTPRLEYEVRDPEGRTFKRDIIVDLKPWNALAGKATVRVRYLPANGAVSRMVGEPDEGLDDLLLILGGLLLGTLFGAMVALHFAGFGDIEMEGGKIRFRRIDDVDTATAPLVPVGSPPPEPARPVAGPSARAQPDRYRLPRRDLVLGILSIAFGLLGVLAGVVQIVVSPLVTDSSAVIAWKGTDLVLALLLALSGVALLARMGWGRRLALTAAAGQVVSSLAALAKLVVGVVSSPPAEPTLLLATGGALVVYALGMVYPIVVLALLGRRRP